MIPEKDGEEDGEDDNDGEWDVHAVHQPHRGHTPPPEKGYSVTFRVHTEWQWLFLAYI